MGTCVRGQNGFQLGEEVSSERIARAILEFLCANVPLVASRNGVKRGVMRPQHWAWEFTRLHTCPQDRVCMILTYQRRLYSIPQSRNRELPSSSKGPTATAVYWFDCLRRLLAFYQGS